MYVKSQFQKTQRSLAPGLVTLPCVAKPFLKWVGGKTQLVEQLDSNIPDGLAAGSIRCYVEPFVGGGSFFFHVAQKFQLEKLVIADSNQDLILAYWTIRDRVDDLIDTLEDIQKAYLSLEESERQEFYYKTRDVFNAGKFSVDPQSFSSDWIERTAQLIFLNKTCFNGLFRVNASGMFNVAFGRYENPKICDPGNLTAVSRILERTEILLGDFTCVKEHMDSKTFAYLDPPYRPLSATSNFTAYSSSTFTHSDQQRLAEFCGMANRLGSKLMISNSDPDNIGAVDTYFEDNYPGFRIVRAFANRMVNCKADKRGKISELIIMNYPIDSDDSMTSDKVETMIDEVKSTTADEVKPDTTELVKSSVPEKNSTKRNAAALGAFQFLHEHAKKGSSFSLDDLQKATGWKLQTARTYVSKKWKHYLEPIEEANSNQFKVRSSFLRLDEQGFLLEFSQVLGAKPSTIDEAREQALAALTVYADMLGSALDVDEEKRIRKLLSQIRK